MATATTRRSIYAVIEEMRALMDRALGESRAILSEDNGDLRDGDADLLDSFALDVEAAIARADELLVPPALAARCGGCGRRGNRRRSCQWCSARSWLTPEAERRIARRERRRLGRA